MTSRTFVDADGVSWQVWDVYPELAERRTHERRHDAAAALVAGRERRAIERRRRIEKRVAVRPGFEHGWLAFDSPLGLRRLAPIPPEWSDLPASALEQLCRAALDAARPRRRLIE